MNKSFDYELAAQRISTKSPSLHASPFLNRQTIMSNSYEIKGAMAGIEVRELQEEEKHIQILKQQIEKIEQYKNVMRKKDK